MTTTELEILFCILLVNIAIITNPIATYIILKKQNNKKET